MTVVLGADLVATLGLMQAGGRARLFHGTSEPLVGPVRVGDYDRVFWSATTPAIAQSYIPASGGETLLAINGFEMGQTVRPSKTSIATSIVKMMGFEPIAVTWDDRGCAKSWRVPEGYPTNQDLSRYVEEVLGYRNSETVAGCRDRRYWIKTGSWDSQSQLHHVMPADYKMPGTLLIVEGIESLRFLDISRGESDLGDLQYHRLAVFESARRAGLDGVVIDDFAQTKHWGNVGHRSIGFFEPERLQITRVPAVRFDHEPTLGGLNAITTPEYQAWAATSAQVDGSPRSASSDSVLDLPHVQLLEMAGQPEWRTSRSMASSAESVRESLRMR